VSDGSGYICDAEELIDAGGGPKSGRRRRKLKLKNDEFPSGAKFDMEGRHRVR